MAVFSAAAPIGLAFSAALVALSSGVHTAHSAPVHEWDSRMITTSGVAVALYVSGPSESPSPTPRPAPSVRRPRSRKGARRLLGFTQAGYAQPDA
jgi:hypothetical protein